MSIWSKLFRRGGQPQKRPDFSGAATLHEYVRVAEVAEVLAVIADPPNRREQPIDGDLEGRFDFWFDGGACEIVTGHTDYLFLNGMKVKLPCARGLAIEIAFPDGRVVLVRQQV